MKRIMMVGLCLASAFAMSAVAAATASAVQLATPQFRFASGSKEFSTRGGIGELETTKGEKVICEEQGSHGELEGASPSHRIRDLLILYRKCTSKTANETRTCQSATGVNSGEIHTFDLLARLGWLSKAENKVGVLINPEEGIAGNKENLFAEFKCYKTKGEIGEITVKVKGSIIALITPVNTLIEPGHSFTVTFDKGSGAGELGPDRKFEGLPENEIRTETTITAKEGKGFIPSAAKGTVELFPLVSTELCTEM